MKKGIFILLFIVITSSCYAGHTGGYGTNASELEDNGATLKFDSSDDRWESNKDVYGTNNPLIFTVPDPNGLYGTDTQICIVLSTLEAWTITRIRITCDADPTTELDMDLKYADAFIGLANATVIDVIDTTSGTTDISSGFDNADIPLGKCLYIEFGAEPDSDITQFGVIIERELQ
jgi:hypothetical protein